MNECSESRMRALSSLFLAHGGCSSAGAAAERHLSGCSLPCRDDLPFEGRIQFSSCSKGHPINKRWRSEALLCTSPLTCGRRRSRVGRIGFPIGFPPFLFPDIMLPNALTRRHGERGGGGGSGQSCQPSRLTPGCVRAATSAFHHLTAQPVSLPVHPPPPHTHTPRQAHSASLLARPASVTSV